MSVSDFHKVMEMLPFLTHAEMAQVSTKIMILKSVGNGATNERDFSDVVLESIARTMMRFGADLSSSMALKKANGYNTFKEKVRMLESYFTQATHNRAAQYRLVDIATEMLYQDLRSMPYPISSRVMMNNIHRIPAVMNHNFPGYAASGMLELLTHEQVKL